MFKRKAILMIHGFAGSIADIEKLANYLELESSFSVFVFTLPGHESMFTMNKTKEDWMKAATDKIEWLEQNGYDKIYVVGHSMGGVIACYLATKYSSIKKIVLLGAAFKYLKTTDNKLNIKDSIKKIPIVMKDYESPMVANMVSKSSVKAIKNFVLLVQEHYDDVLKVTQDILIIQGKSDRLVPIESGKYIHENVASKTNYLVLIKDVTHDYCNKKRKEEIFYLVKDFLKYKHLKIKKTTEI